MIMKTIKALWIGAAVCVLFITIDAYYSVHDKDIWDVLAWLMLILSFPAGLVVSLVLLVLEMEFSIISKTSYLSLALGWAGYFVLGYLQWFELTPHLIAKLCALKKNGNFRNVSPQNYANGN